MAEPGEGLNWVDSVLTLPALVIVFGIAVGKPLLLGVVAVVVAVAFVCSAYLCGRGRAYEWTLRFVVAFLFALLVGPELAWTGPVKGSKSAFYMIVVLLPLLPLALAWNQYRNQNWGRWSVLAMFLGMLVAVFSGDAGSDGPMVSWFQGWFGWSLEQTEQLTFVVRKSIHVSFYALMFLAMARASWLSRGSFWPSAATGFLWALGHALFDEGVQSLSTERSGQATDVLIDVAGMGVGLAVAWLWWGRRVTGDG